MSTNVSQPPSSSPSPEHPEVTASADAAPRSNEDALGADATTPPVDAAPSAPGAEAPAANVDAAPSTPGAEAPAANVDAAPPSVKETSLPSGTSQRWFRGTSAKELNLIDRRLRRALVLQVIVGSVVFGYWLWGKVSWNHDPMVSQRYRPAEVSVLSNRAQNAALEFHHSLVSGQYGQARILVDEIAEALVDEASGACQPTAPCSTKEAVFTRATLLRSLGREAHVHVESFAKSGTLLSEAAYDVSNVSGQWLVVGRRER